jgi:hypothetical protein
VFRSTRLPPFGARLIRLEQIAQARSGISANDINVTAQMLPGSRGGEARRGVWAALTLRQPSAGKVRASGDASTLQRGAFRTPVRHPADARRCRPTFLPLRGEDLEEAQWLMSFRFSKVWRSMTMQPK